MKVIFFKDEKKVERKEDCRKSEDYKRKTV
jgi:hypothetical protein